MILLFDPYANRQWSMSDIRLVNKVADALICAHEDIDLKALSGSIHSLYKPGMQAHALMVHVSRQLAYGRAGQKQAD